MWILGIVIPLCLALCSPRLIHYLLTSVINYPMDIAGPKNEHCFFKPDVPDPKVKLTLNTSGMRSCPRIRCSLSALIGTKSSGFLDIAAESRKNLMPCCPATITLIPKLRLAMNSPSPSDGKMLKTELSLYCVKRRHTLKLICSFLSYNQ